MLHTNSSCYLKPQRFEFDSNLEATRIAIATRISQAIKKNKMTHTTAAEIVGLGRTTITAVVNENIEKISTDSLLKIAHRLGLRIQIKIW